MIINGWYGETDEQIGTLLQQYRYLQSNFEAVKVIYLGLQPERLELPFPKITLWQCDSSEKEAVLDQLAEEIPKDSCILFGYDSVSMELAARLAIRKKGTSLTRVEKLVCDENGMTAFKKICSGNMMGCYSLRSSPFCLALQKYTGDSCAENCTVEWEINPILAAPKRIVCVREEHEPADIDLRKAERVLVVGNGIKKKEDVARLEVLAKQIHAEIGATRPVTMQGLLPLQNLVGVSGAIIHPKVCIAVGVSGMAALYEGIENSECILAVNRDPEAPIMKKADFVLCGDWKDLL